jgi:hypothetical protein
MQLHSLQLAHAFSLAKAVVHTLAHPRCIAAHGMSWQWAEQVLQQLLKCAVPAGLLRGLPGGCMDAAAVALLAVGQTLGSSSGTKSRAVVDAECLICTSIAASAGCLFEAALRQRDATKGKGEEEMQEKFVSQPAVAEAALQLLAVRCLLVQQQLQHWQQQQRGLMLRQQGRHMRGDVLLLLPSDLQQHLAQLLPPGVMIDVVAADPTAGQTPNDTQQASSIGMR